ncbi:MAG: aspartate dehydrogenase [Lachnospiraceae bacterium]|nr:aspartate dehydrogenase [Lachnospiraceae bacterium]
MSIFSEIFKKKVPGAGFDPEKLEPMIRASICTGEKVAGFMEKGTGKFKEVMLLKDDADLKAFRKRYGIKEEIKTFY